MVNDLCINGQEVLLRVLAAYQKEHGRDMTATALWGVFRSYIAESANNYFHYPDYQLKGVEPNGGFLRDISKLEERG